MEYASAYMVLGKNPEKTRKKLWESGKIHKAATKTVCRLDTSPDSTLCKGLDSGSHEELQRLHPVADAELQAVTLPDGRQLQWPNPTHQQIADVITSHVPAPGSPGLNSATSPGRPEPAKIGHDSTVCNDHEDGVHQDQPG